MNIIGRWKSITDLVVVTSGLNKLFFRTLLTILLLACNPGLAAVSVHEDMANSDTRLRSAGERIFREGISTTDLPLIARVESDITVSGNKVACVTCHQRSGLGSSEAATLIPPIIGSKLFLPRTTLNPSQASLIVKINPPGARPAYDKKTLARALRLGVDSSGHALNPLMPRYELTDDDIIALSAYLNSLGAKPDPGVDNEAIHFASVVMPDASPIQRKAMSDVLEAFFRDRNAATRNEPQRAEHAPWHKEWTAHAYRKWKLHIWELTGPASSWPEQLEEYYRIQPVFALLGGVGESEWQPIHRFCESNRVPCVFPSTDLPDVTDGDFYSLYFSKGLLLEAETLAAHLSQRRAMHQDSSATRRILQVYRNDERGKYIAQAFRKALQNRGITQTDDIVWSDDAEIMLARSREIFQARDGFVIVYWLDAHDLHSIGKILENHNGPPDRYFSSTLLDAVVESVPLDFRNSGYLLHPFAQRERWQQQLLRVNLWLNNKNIDSTDQRTMADTYFAATLVRGAVHKIQGNFSRDYFIERIEHMVENTLTPSIYPRLSLGPGQRFASKGCYILELNETEKDGQPNQVLWLTP